MRKVIVLFILTTIAYSCAGVKQEIEKKYIIGQWIEIEKRTTEKSPIQYITTDCSDDSPKGLIYDFKADGTFSQKGICPDGKPEKKGTWSYNDNILDLNMTTSGKEMKYKYAVLNQGNSQIKLSFVVFIGDEVVIDYVKGYYVILEKQ